MEYSDFLERMNEIKKMGYVDSHRTGPTGIGKTLEDLLGIQENNIPGPNLSGMYELKSARRDASSMLTLFTKSPEPWAVNSKLREVYGYKSRTNARARGNELHVTVDSIKPNSVGLQLTMEDDRLYIVNNEDVKAYYEESTLKDVFEKKYHKLLYVLAENRWIGRTEQFWFNAVYLLDGFSFNRFSDLIRRGILKVDIRLGHYSDGRPHDHGTGFRILPKYLPECFEKIERII